MDWSVMLKVMRQVVRLKKILKVTEDPPLINQLVRRLLEQERIIERLSRQVLRRPAPPPPPPQPEVNAYDKPRSLRDKIAHISNG